MRCLYQKGNTHFAKSTEKREAIKIRTLFILYLVSAITHTHTRVHAHTRTCSLVKVSKKWLVVLKWDKEGQARGGDFTFSFIFSSSKFTYTKYINFAFKN